MLTSKESRRYTFLILAIFLIFICSFFIINSEVISLANDNAPIYKIGITEDIQRDIWKYCGENDLSYELVLAIYKTDGINNNEADNMKTEIEKLAYIRDYWADKGYSDELVFDLLLISRQRGLEGCKTLMKNNDSYESFDDDSYVQEVADYKYYLERDLDLEMAASINKPQDISSPTLAATEKLQI